MFVEAVLIALGFGVFVLKFILPNPTKYHLLGSHVIITGGSSGIGKCLAEEAFKAGANVTLLARDFKKLTEAQNYLLEKYKGYHQNNVQVFSIDISGDYEAVNDAIKKSEEKFGPVDILINSAGFSFASKLEDIPISSFKKLMDLNYFGSLFCTKAVIGGMKERRRGRVVFISSQAGQLGVFGFSGYSASKFALKGLAECLQMEVSPYGVRVCIAYPPDTNTPGFEEENKTKPAETALISAESGLWEPSAVAKNILNGVLEGKFNIPIGLEGFFLSTLTSGMSPATHLTEALLQIMTMGVMRVVSLGLLFKFNRIVAGCKQKDHQHS